MKQLLAILLITIASFSVAYSQQRQQPTSQLVEQFSFSIPSFEMNHQGETNKLNISISYRYAINIANSEYPDFRWLAKDLETLLKDYPNKEDYWEIVNKRVTSVLLQKYPAITSITSEFEVAPSRLVPYNRSSRVTRSRLPVRTKKSR